MEYKESQKCRPSLSFRLRVVKIVGPLLIAHTASGIISILLLTLFPLDANGQKPTDNTPKCRLLVANGLFAPEKPPVLFADKFTVPEMLFRFQPDKNSPSVVDRIDIFYVWEWLEYPSDANSRGTWIESSDIVECEFNGEQNYSIPTFDVVPKGWYEGEFANKRSGNLPHFDHVEVSFITQKCGTPRIIFQGRQIEKFRRMIALISLPCGELPKVTFASK